MMKIPILPLAAALAVLAAVPALAADGGTDWDNRRDDARAHASAIKQAWASLAAWIERTPQTGDPDLDVTRSRGPHVWTDGIASPGLLKAVYDSAAPGDEIWRQAWSDRG